MNTPGGRSRAAAGRSRDRNLLLSEAAFVLGRAVNRRITLVKYFHFTVIFSDGECRGRKVEVESTLMMDTNESPAAGCLVSTGPHGQQH